MHRSRLAGAESVNAFLANAATAPEDLEQETGKGGIEAEDPGMLTVPHLLTDPLDGRAIQKVT